MNPLNDLEFADECVKKGPQSVLETMLLEEYLHGKGYSLSDMHLLPSEQANNLMKEACQYASLQLAQVESKAHFRDRVHIPS